VLVVDTKAVAQAVQAAEDATSAAAQAAGSAAELQQALLHPPPLAGRLEVVSSPTVRLSTEGAGTTGEPMTITGTMLPGAILDRLQVADSPSLKLSIDGSGTVDDPAVIRGDIPRLDENAGNIAENNQAIQNLIADLAAMFARLGEIEQQAGINAGNINHLGERITELEKPKT
jgi:hypothetical protein